MGSLDTIGGSTAGGGGAATTVTPPSPTNQNVAAGASLSAVTFGSFSGSGASSIASYQATVTNSNGSTSFSGSGLGAWTPSGEADGSAGVLSLTAKDAAGNALATAVHSFRRAMATEAWVNTLDLDLTTISGGSTTLNTGSTTLAGRVFEVEGTQSVGGGAGLTATAGDDVLMTVSDAFTSQDTPRMVILKITMPAGFGGVNTGHAVRARLYSGGSSGTGGISNLGASPSCQTRYYPNSGNMRFQVQYQARTPSSTGTFTSSSSYDHSGEAGTTTWFSRIVMLRGTYYTSIHKTLAAATPATLNAVMDTAADTITAGINDFQEIGTASFFPAQMWVGLFNQNANSLGVLERVLCYEFK
jgi:hypothetical protein